MPPIPIEDCVFKLLEWRQHGVQQKTTVAEQEEVEPVLTFAETQSDVMPQRRIMLTPEQTEDAHGKKNLVWGGYSSGGRARVVH